MFSLVDSLLFRPLPVDLARDAGRCLHDRRRRRRVRDQFLPGLPRPQGAEHRLQRHDRLQPDDGAAQPRRSIAHRARPGRDLESLHDARRAAVARPAARAVGRRARRRARRRDLASHVAARVRQRSGDRRQDAHAARPAVHDRRRRAGVVHRRRAAADARAVAADSARRRSRARRHQRLGAVADRQRRGSSAAASAGCSSRAD